MTTATEFARTIATGTQRSRSGREAQAGVWAKAVSALFLLVVVLQCLAQAGAAKAGHPYENWDEVTDFNNSYVLSGPTDGRNFRYGSMHTLLQFAGIMIFDAFDPLGKDYRHIRYSNNVPQSWDDPFLAFRPKTWTGLDYNYFRGVDDRQPMFYSRYLHLIFAWAAAAAIGMWVIAVYGASAVFPLVSLLCLTAVPEAWFQMTQTLPNGINAVLAFGIGLFAIMYVDTRRNLFICASTGCLALALNFKGDVFLAGAVPALAVGLRAVTDSPRAAIRGAAAGAGIFAAVLVLTCPDILIEPVANLRNRYHAVNDAATGGLPVTKLAANASLFSGFVTRSMLIAAVGVAGATALAFGSRSARQAIRPIMRQPATVMALLSMLIGMAVWAAVTLRAPVLAERYYLNGASLVFAGLGAFAMFAARRAAFGREFGAVILAALAVQYATHAGAAVLQSYGTVKAALLHDGFDPAHHRNLAELAAVDLIREERFRPVVLVDQHSYTDLRLLRMHGIEAIYVNAANLDRILAGLAHGQYLVIFSRGDYAANRGIYAAWEGDWAPETRHLYDRYLGRLMSLPVVRHFSGPPQNLLSAAPVNPDDDIYLSIVAKP